MAGGLGCSASRLPAATSSPGTRVSSEGLAGAIPGRPSRRNPTRTTSAIYQKITPVFFYDPVIGHGPLCFAWKKNGFFAGTPIPSFQRYRRSSFAISSGEFSHHSIFYQSMASAAFKWSGRSLSRPLQILGRNQRNHESSSRPLLSPNRSFFTALDANTFDHANLDYLPVLPIESRLSERSSYVQDTPVFFRRGVSTNPLDTAVRKPCSAVSTSSDLAELIGCEPHHKDMRQEKSERNSTIRALPLSFREGLAHNVIFE